MWNWMAAIATLQTLIQVCKFKALIYPLSTPKNVLTTQIWKLYCSFYEGVKLYSKVMIVSPRDSFIRTVSPTIRNRLLWLLELIWWVLKYQSLCRVFIVSHLLFPSFQLIYVIIYFIIKVFYNARRYLNYILCQNILVMHPFWNSMWALLQYFLKIETLKCASTSGSVRSTRGLGPTMTTRGWVSVSRLVCYRKHWLCLD
jgi:hypothetical protein